MNDETMLPTTKWIPGMSSPNPLGRPKSVRSIKEVRDLAREATPMAIKTLKAVAGNAKAPPAARVAAATALLDRAWGKPASTDLEGAEQLVIRILKLSDNNGDDAKVIEGELSDG